MSLKLAKLMELVGGEGNKSSNSEECFYEDLYKNYIEFCEMMSNTGNNYSRKVMEKNIVEEEKFLNIEEGCKFENEK